MVGTLIPSAAIRSVIGAAVVFLVLLLLASADLRKLAPRRRAALIALRVAIFLAVIAGMLRPTYVFTEMKRHRATVIVLADRSRSMSVADEFKGLTRWKRLTDEVEKALPAFRDLTEDLDVKFYTFDADIGPVDLADKNFTLGNKADGAADGHRRRARRCASQRDRASIGRRHLIKRRCAECARAARRRPASRR